jgi:hypothetical protein
LIFNFKPVKIRDPVFTGINSHFVLFWDEVFYVYTHRSISVEVGANNLLRINTKPFFPWLAVPETVT